MENVADHIAGTRTAEKVKHANKQVALVKGVASEVFANEIVDLSSISPREVQPLAALHGEGRKGQTLGANSMHLQRAGRAWLPTMGEFPFSRYPSEFWTDELRKVKAGGIEVISSYVLWNHHEEIEGKFDWAGRRNLRRFVECCASEDLLVFLRIGPFCHGEVRNGGLPDWMYGQSFDVRSNDERYLSYVERFYNQIGRQVDDLLYRDGGPIIGVQIENEFMSSGAPWEVTSYPDTEWVSAGSGGEEHMRRLKRLAQKAGLNVPLYACTGWGGSPVPAGEFLPMSGGYAFHAWENDPNQSPTDQYVFCDFRGQPVENYDPSAVPHACCEMGGGMQVFHKNRPVVPPESVEAMSVVKLGSGTNVLGYYVYHGGSNPVGAKTFLNEHRCPRISYDFQAPIREFGQFSPSYGRLKRVCLFVNDFGERLAPMKTFLPNDAEDIHPETIDRPRIAVRAGENGGFVFLNNYQDHLETRKQTGVQITIRLPQETISIPARGGFDIPSDTSMILPFHLDLTGLRVQYSTAQLITHLAVDDEPYYFFFAPEGSAPEYLLDGRTCRQVCIRQGRLLDDGMGNMLVRVQPGTECELTAILHDGTSVHIVTLTEEQSRQIYKGHAWGRQRILLSEAGVMFGRDEIDLMQMDSPEMILSVFPPVPSLRCPDAEMHENTNGLFQQWRLRLPKKHIAMQVEGISDRKAVVRLPENALEGLNEVYLRVHYTGDIGSAYLDGNLIHDNFCNGTPWEIGIRRYAPRILATDIVLSVLPTEEEVPKVEFTDMAGIRVVNGGEHHEYIHSIEVLCEYRTSLRATGSEKIPFPPDASGNNPKENRM